MTYITKANGLLAWHFLRTDRLTANGECILVQSGQTLKLDKSVKPILCQRGYHASVRALDALGFAPGLMVCRVKLWGEVVQASDKAVATRRTCLWVADATRAVQEFALWCAEQAFEAIHAIGIEPDKRSVDAVNIARLWLVGTATKEELNAAAYAAYAAYAAAYAAYAANAAAYAANAAAYAANAAYAAANAAYAAKEKQNLQLEAMLIKLESEAA